MRKLIVLLFLSNLSWGQDFSQNEKDLQTLLDTLDNPYYWTLVPENSMSIRPAINTYEDYPNKVALFEKLHKIDSLLKMPLSNAFLLTLFDKKHYHKVTNKYPWIADKIFDSKDIDSIKTLWNLVNVRNDDSFELLNRTPFYIVNKLIYLDILKDETRKFIYEKEYYHPSFFGYYDSKTDFKILNIEIKGLKSELKKPDMGDAPRWASYLYLDGGLRFRNCGIDMRAW
ncbi:MAG: hypothetical protein ACRCVT_14650, partial [Leadbetterella sp.]